MFAICRHWSLHRFLCSFLMENGTHMAPKNYVPRSSFRSILLTCFEHRLSDAFWSPCGSLLVPCGSLLAHFWCPLAHFLVPLSLDFLIGSWRHSSYCVIFPKKILCRIIFLKKKSPIDVWPNVPLLFFRKVVSAVAETRLCRAKDKKECPFYFDITLLHHCVFVGDR